MALLLVIWSVASAESISGPKPLIRVHAHNDYQHSRPLFDALDQGFCSVEADIHLVDGKLLVAHNRSQVRADRTLESLYLEPLRKRVLQNSGHVFPNGPLFYLLIDIKGKWQKTYPVLRAVLQQFTDIITTFEGTARSSRGILIVLTGDRSPRMFDGESMRYACLDGTLADLESDASVDLVPWVSADWSETFKWRGRGEMPAEDRERLKKFVAQGHATKRLLRFWGAPDAPAVWGELLACNVDLINTDDLVGARKFFDSQP